MQNGNFFSKVQSKVVYSPNAYSQVLHVLTKYLEEIQLHHELPLQLQDLLDPLVSHNR